MNNRNELIIVIVTTALLAFTVFAALNMGTGCGRGGNGLSEKARQVVGDMAQNARKKKEYNPIKLSADGWSIRLSETETFRSWTPRSSRLNTRSSMSC